MKSRRDRPSCFFVVILLPSKHRKTGASSLQGWKELGRSDDATVQARESIAGVGGKNQCPEGVRGYAWKNSASLAMRPLLTREAEFFQAYPQIGRAHV